MKIGVVCPYDIFRGGGVQEHVIAQAEELRRRGHTVKVITPRPRKAHKTPPEHIIFMGTSATLKTPISTSLELGATFTRDGIDDLLAKEKFDLLHIHEPEVPLLGAQMISKASCPVVATFHAIHPETPMARTIEVLRVPYAKSIFSKLQGITAVSDVAAGFVRQQTKRRVLIIPNGIDLEKYNATDATKKSVSKKIVFVGRLEKRKGVQCLLDAFALLARQDSDVALQIVGDGPDRSKLKERVKSKKIPQVSFAGFVDEATKIKMMREADIFCSPALYGESFGIVLLEAIALGTVVVAGDNPGYAAVMQGPGAMSIVNPKDTKAFAAKLDELLNDQDLRRVWKDWAENYVQQFSYKNIVDKYEALYRRIVESGQKV